MQAALLTLSAGPGLDPGWMDAIIDPLETRTLISMVASGARTVGVGGSAGDGEHAGTGSTSVTGHGYRFADEPGRSGEAAALVEVWSTPVFDARAGDRAPLAVVDRLAERGGGLEVAHRALGLDRRRGDDPLDAAHPERVEVVGDERRHLGQRALGL